MTWLGTTGPAGLPSRVIDYIPETGLLFWKARQPELFSGATDPIAASIAFNARFAGKRAFTAIGSDGYFRGRILGKYTAAHIVAWAVYHGEWPKQSIDHINQNRRDNRICNLRLVSHTENSRNMRLSHRNTSGHAGVFKRSPHERWRAHITLGNKTIYLGVFDTFEQAVAARRAAEREHGFSDNHGKRGGVA